MTRNIPRALLAASGIRSLGQSERKALVQLAELPPPLSAMSSLLHYLDYSVLLLRHVCLSAISAGNYSRNISFSFDIIIMG